jgi:hypothetical protein
VSDYDWPADPGTDVGDDGDLPDDPLIEDDDFDLDDEDWSDEDER